MKYYFSLIQPFKTVNTIPLIPVFSYDSVTVFFVRLVAKSFSGMMKSILSATWLLLATASSWTAGRTWKDKRWEKSFPVRGTNLSDNPQPAQIGRYTGNGNAEDTWRELLKNKEKASGKRTQHLREQRFQTWYRMLAESTAELPTSWLCRAGCPWLSLSQFPHWWMGIMKVPNSLEYSEE